MTNPLTLFLRGDRQADRVVPPSGHTAWLTSFTAGAMTFLAVFALALALASGRMADRWSDALARTATVRISAPPDQIEMQTRVVLDVLATTPGVESAKALSDEEQRKLLEPWFGPDLPVEALPIPRLIELTETAQGYDAEGLRQRLAAEAPGAVLDDHTRWRRPLATAAGRLRVLGYLSILLIGGPLAETLALALPEESDAAGGYGDEAEDPQAIADMDAAAEMAAAMGGEGAGPAPEEPAPPLIATPEAIAGGLSTDLADWSPDPLPIHATADRTLEALTQPGVDIVLPVDALALYDSAAGRTDPSLPLPLSALPSRGAETVAVDADGFVKPTRAGALAPGGYRVFEGSPRIVPPHRPAPDPEAATVLADASPAPPGAHPRARPEGLAERHERLELGGKTRAELAGLRPGPRPAAKAAAFLAARQPVEPEVLTAEAGTAKPAPRPDGLKPAPQPAQARALAAVAPASTAAVLTKPAKPEPAAKATKPAPAAKAEKPVQTAALTAPDTAPRAAPANVALAATGDDGINLNRINLLGTFGKPGQLRALVRMPGGKVVNVSVGDKLDGGRVVAISQSELRYAKGNRNEVIAMPNG